MSNTLNFTVQPSPLRLEGYFINSLSFSIPEDVVEKDLNTLHVRPGFQPRVTDELPEACPQFDVGFNLEVDDEHEGMFRATLKLVSLPVEDIRRAYDFSIEVVGVYQWLPDNKTQDVEIAIRLSAANTLYGVAREALAMITGRTALPAMILPLIQFIYTQNEEGEQSLQVIHTPGKNSLKKQKKGKNNTFYL